MLTQATPEQNETFEVLRNLFLRAGARFMLVGGAACREHGLPRPAKDLDIVLDPYPVAMTALKTSRRFSERLGDADWTGRTSTYFDARTGVNIDFITAGIRINDGPATRSSVKDPLAIPYPVEVVAPPEILIGMKLSAVITGEALLNLGIHRGRSRQEIDQDLNDVCGLISACSLGRDISADHDVVRHRYQELWDKIRGPCIQSTTNPS